MQQTHLRLPRQRSVYPWELTDETRQIGKQGLARVRAILEAKDTEPGQLRLELNFAETTPNAVATVTPLPAPAAPARITARLAA